MSPLASVPYTTTNTPVSWDTAADWDAAPVSYGLVHDSYGDLPGTGTVQLGYPVADPGGTNLHSFWSLHEDRPVDLVSNTNATAVTGTTANASALFGGTGFSFDGVDDGVRTGVTGPSGSANRTVLLWVYPRSQSTTSPTLFSYGTDVTGGRWDLRVNTNNYLRLELQGNGETSSLVVPSNQWVFVACRLNGSNLSDHTLFVDGTTHNITSTLSVNTGTQVSICYGTNIRQYDSGTYGGDRNFDGIFQNVRVYDRALSDTEIAAHRLTTASNSLTTASKSFASTVTPDLTGLSYALNGGGIILDVTGSPGTASEETVSQTLDGASSYPLTWGASHTEFQVTMTLSPPSDASASPTVSGVTLA